MYTYKVEILDGYGKNPDILDVIHSDSLTEADCIAEENKPSRVARVRHDRYEYRSFGKWDK